MFLQYDQVFSSDCSYEIDRRSRGLSNYGPSKVYAIASCETETIKIGTIKKQFKYKEIAVGIVVIDCFIMFFFSICIFKLRFRE
jgi:hypothetical protein